MSNALDIQPHRQNDARREIAAAVRAHLAVRNMKDTELARRIGWSQSKMSRRTNEDTPFDSDDLGTIAAELELSLVELIQMPTSVPGDTPAVKAPQKTIAYIANDDGNVAFPNFGLRFKTGA